MLFNSLEFIYLFLPATYLVFWLLRTKGQRYFWLTVTGYLFYSWWNYKFCALMAFSTVASYLAGLGFLKWGHPRRRLLCLVVPVTLDLALLGFFKYAGFFAASLNSAARLSGVDLGLPYLDVVLPVGISFYTFHTITYIVDSYRRVITPTRNFFEFSCYVSLFSQLVAGPIVRFRQIEADLERIDRAERKAYLDVGFSFFIIGLAKKVIIADSLAAMINPLIADHAQFSTLTAWLAMLGYAYQIYFDFSGYSDMAVGLGYLFGIRLPQNFNSPYKAGDIGDFWRRWHISLSTCLRDYLYIPMGGSREGAWRTYRNLFITMLLGGLWHGANWTFIIWGVYHGLLLALHRAAHQKWDLLPPLLRRGLTFVLVTLGWVIFRSDNVHMAGAWLASLCGGAAGGSTPPWTAALGLGLLLCAGLSHGFPNTFELSHSWSRRSVIGLGLLFLVSLFLIYSGAYSPFLYFQF